MINYDISNMSKKEINDLIKNHFGESQNKFAVQWIFWILFTFSGIFILIGLTNYSQSIFIIAIIIWLLIVVIGLSFILKDLIKFGKEEKIIIEIIKYDKKSKSKLISKETRQIIPDKFLTIKGLK